MEIKGKTAIITGSTGRLGYCIAENLARAGCNCICHYHRNPDRAGELIRQIETIGPKALAVQADLAAPEGIEFLVDKIALSINESIIVKVPWLVRFFDQG